MPKHRTITEILDSLKREGWTFPQAWVLQSGDKVKVVLPDGRTAEATLEGPQNVLDTTRI